MSLFFFFFNDTATTEIYTLSLHDALPIYLAAVDIESRVLRADLDRLVELLDRQVVGALLRQLHALVGVLGGDRKSTRLELQSRQYLVCRLLLEKKKM